MELSRGGNAPLAPGGPATVLIRWGASPAPLDIACFMVGPDGKVPGDEFMIFYNQPASPDNEVCMRWPDTGQAETTVTLDRVPAGIQRCIFTATLDGPGTFATVGGLSVTCSAGSARVTYPIREAAQERALILAELYRHSSGWKVRAIGQGFNGGLAPLAKAHGVVVEDEAPAPAPPPAPAPVAAPAPAPAPAPAAAPKPAAAPVNLGKIDLLKQQAKISLEKKGAAGVVARVCIAIDASGSMSTLYNRGTVQRAVERALGAAAAMDDDGQMEVWFFADRSMRGPAVTAADVEGYVKRVYPKPQIFGPLGGSNNEPAVMEDILKRYTQEAPQGPPVFVIFLSDGGVSRSREISSLIRDAAQYPIFWQFVGIGRSNYGVLAKLDTLPGRVVDNAGFFSLDDLDKISDSELYDRLLSEFPQWLQAARRAGVLRS